MDDNNQHGENQIRQAIRESQEADRNLAKSSVGLLLFIAALALIVPPLAFFAYLSQRAPGCWSPYERRVAFLIIFFTRKGGMIVSISTKLSYNGNMMVSLSTPQEILADLAALLKERRLADNITQEQLAGRANVSLSVLRKFERTGKISLESFVKLAFVLGLTDPILEAMKVKESMPSSLDKLMEKEEATKRKHAYPKREDRDG